MKQYLIRYILHGQGLGYFLLFVLSFVVALCYALVFRSPLLQMVPVLQKQTEKFCPVHIENGAVTYPLNTVIESRLLEDDQNNEKFVLVLDTTVDELSQNGLDSGFYLTRSFLYYVLDNKIERFKLKGDHTFEQKDYTSSLEKLMRWLVLGVAALILLCCFVYFSVLAAFYSFVLYLVGLVMKYKTNTDMRMRLVSVVLVFFVVLEKVLLFWGIALPFGVFSLLLVAVSMVLMRFIQMLPEAQMAGKNKF